MEIFLEKMKKLLGDEYDAYVKSMSEKSFKGLRVNTLKADSESVRALLPFKIVETPFYKHGYYIDNDVKHIGSHPLHHAGAIYMQEPSAMSAVSMLRVEKGDRVLDLCAAPGSKTTQIAQELQGTGLLWSNEIVSSRANILLSNLERCGVKNAVVSNTSPEVLSEELGGFFDKILVDAPCSGEGMFRKDEKAKEEWSAEHVLSCANRQLHILNSAKSMLRVGGVLVYSTCTFSVEENEGVVTRFLEENPEFELSDSGEDFGRNTLTHCKRIFPMDGGEGHFAARFVKRGEQESYAVNNSRKDKRKNTTKPVFIKADKEAYDFVREIFNDEYNLLYCVNCKVYAVNVEIEELINSKVDFKKLCVKRVGVEVCENKGKRYEPLHNAFTACSFAGAKNVINLDLNDEKVYKFLHGEEIKIDESIKGYTLVCVNGISLGFGKASNGNLKNKYPKGLRNNG